MISDFLALARWWAVLLLLSMALLPLTLSVFGGLRDKGWAFSKVLGLALCSWLSFTSSSFHLVPFRVWGCWLFVGAAALACWFPAFLRRRRAGSVWQTALGSGTFWRRALVEEVIFLAALAFWAWLRATNPDLRDLEKFMDHGFVASILNSDWMPAADMWYAGEGINYYYYGHFATAFLCRLAGVGSAVGYNLMMATTFALTLSLAGALGYDLLGLKGFKGRGCAAGGAACSLLVAVGGNGHAFLFGVLLPFLNRLGLVDYTENYWYPDATRFINCYEGSTDNTIHEFPFYSFIVSDLHAHVLDICFVLLFLALSLVWLSRARQNASRQTPLWESLADPAFWLCGFFLGVMAMTNYWDFAIYTIVSVFFVFWAAGMRCAPGQKSFWAEGALRLALLPALRSLSSLPFSLSFDSMSAGIGLVAQSSPLPQFLALWYLPLGCFAAYLIFLFFTERRRLGRWPFGPLEEEEGWQVLYEVPARGALPGRENGFSRWLNSFDLPDLFVFFCYLCGLGLLIGPELLYLKDIYPSAPRANTMFKLTYQAFILFGLAMGYSLARWWAAAAGQRRPRRLLRRLALVCCLAIPLCYTPLALKSTYWGREYQGLDGLAFIEQEAPNEAALIRWIDENAAPDAVVVEAPGASYTQYCRISMATGRATIVGWHTHEWLWRSDLAGVDARGDEVRALYEDGEEAARTVIEAYGVDYIVVGPRERESYPSLDLEALISLSSQQLDFGEYLLLCLN